VKDDYAGFIEMTVRQLTDGYGELVCISSGSEKARVSGIVRFLLLKQFYSVFLMGLTPDSMP